MGFEVVLAFCCRFGKSLLTCLADLCLFIFFPACHKPPSSPLEVKSTKFHNGGPGKAIGRTKGGGDGGKGAGSGTCRWSASLRPGDGRNDFHQACFLVGVKMVTPANRFPRP